MCVALSETFIGLSFEALSYASEECQLYASHHHMNLGSMDMVCAVHPFTRDIFTSNHRPSGNSIQHYDISIDKMSSRERNAAYDEAYRWYNLPHKVSTIFED